MKEKYETNTKVRKEKVKKGKRKGGMNRKNGKEKRK
jgi:hypothetical protein